MFVATWFLLSTPVSMPVPAPKLDINEANQQSLADALRDPAARAGVQLSDDALQALSRRILEYRDSHSGLIHNLDELSGVAGVTPAVLAVIKQVTFPGAFHIGRVEIVGPEDRRGSPAAGYQCCSDRVGSYVGLHCFPI